MRQVEERRHAGAEQFVGRAEKPGEWLEYSPLLTIVITIASWILEAVFPDKD